MIAVWEIGKRFEYHGDDAKVALLYRIAHSYMTMINENVPDGPEKDQCMVKLQEVVFWAVTAATMDSSKDEIPALSNGNGTTE